MTQAPFEFTEEGERQYIEQRWASFSQSAWAAYQRFGRGVVLVTVRPPHAPDKLGLIEYVSEEEAHRVWPGRGWPDAKTASAVKEYDPQKSFLALFLNYETQTCRLHRFEDEQSFS